MDNKKKIIAIGGSGLVGSRILALLSNTFDTRNMSLETGLDITNAQTLTPLLNEPEGAIVFHLAAKADVDGCEKDKSLGEEGAAWKINVQGAENVALTCKKAGHTMIYVSTDFVFDGEKAPEGGYSEEDTAKPINWYGVTKFEGEKRVLASGVKPVIMRIAYPYRKEFAAKLDFVRAIRARLESGQEVKAVTDHIMTPTFIDDIAFALQALIEQNVEGIYHVVGGETLSPYEASMKIASTFGIAHPVITQVQRAAFFAGRAPRPFNLALKNGKIKQLGVRMKTFTEGLREMSS